MKKRFIDRNVEVIARWLKIKKIRRKKRGKWLLKKLLFINPKS